ncbi:hypothetical protein [Nocardioides hwasunensis]|uniref:Uncharacterized protein n=1 Tax=Nocardioides hwasunensis TaxID=397258 RepID=A0ABR8MHI0_9ACTN|nr:hypothetical protein [Nocardioides hwasunensis]MBD3915010.1 hypothetical protein [Nocardioides hwasunensis]
MFVPPPFHERRPDLVAPVRVDPAGVDGPTRGQARGPRWRTTTYGLRVPADVPVTAHQRTVEAAAVLRDDEAVTGWAALAWERARWFDGTSEGLAERPVPLVVRRHVVPQRGAAISQEFLNPADVVVVDGLPVTSHVRSVTFEMRYADGLADAIETIDMACYSDLVSIAEMTAYVGQLGPVTGIQQARDALAEAHENSWSPRETRMRGVWTRLAGLPRPLCNRPVFTLDGKLVATPDLIDPGTGLVGLYHGDSHLTLVGASKDNRQDSDYRDLGLEPVAMFATDWRDLGGFTRRLRTAARRARAHRGPRAWTLEPPPWWTPTDTVARRRALADWQRARYLRYRRAA